MRHMRGVRLFALLCLALAALAAVGACSSGSNGSSSAAAGDPTSAASSAATGTSASAGTGSTATKSPIVVGNVSSVTGPISAAAQYFPVGIKAWAAYVNANGGIDGHPVQVVYADDKSDATTEAADFQQIANANHPVAFVGVGTFDPAGAEAFLQAQKIPVVGGQLADPIWDTSPMFFPEGTSLNAVYYGMAAAAKGKKIGVVYCVETPECSASAKIIGKAAPLTGATVTYSQSYSLTTPDFTASCLAAKAAGVTNMIVLFDEPNILRYAADCAQQGFEPTYEWEGLLPTDKTASATAMKGAVTIQTNYPWFDSSGAGATFHQAMAKYEPGEPIQASTMQAWASGILFQTAATQVLTSGQPLTSATLITALNSLKNETLGGLSGSLSFSATAPKATQNCWFEATSNGSQWTASGASAQCAPASDQSKIPGL